MIKAIFKKDYDGFYSYEVTGHANYAEKGKDIVCAAVSSLYLTISNYLVSKEYAYFDDDEGQTVEISYLDESQPLIKALHQGLVAISAQYPEFVKVGVEIKDSRFIRADPSRITTGTISAKNVNLTSVINSNDEAKYLRRKLI